MPSAAIAAAQGKSAVVMPSGNRGSLASGWVQWPAGVLEATLVLSFPNHADNKGIRADVYVEAADDAAGTNTRLATSMTFVKDATGTDFSSTLSSTLPKPGEYIRGRAEVAPSSARFGLSVSW